MLKGAVFCAGWLLDGGAIDRDDEVDAWDGEIAQPIVVGDEEIDFGSSCAGQLEGVRGLRLRYWRRWE